MEPSFEQLVSDVQQWIAQESNEMPKIVVEGHKPLQIHKKQSVPPQKKPNKEHPLVLSKDFEHVEVFLISQSTEPSIKGLLERLTSAVDTRIAKAKLIDAAFFEQNDLWAELHQASVRLRHILVSEVELYQLPRLLKHYTRSPKRLLFNVPLFLLADLSSYLKDVELKKSLWTTLLSEI